MGATAVAATLGALALTGCGGPAARGDTASFDIQGTVVSVTESGTGTFHVDDAPPLDYSGPLGCRGRYFSTDFNALPLYFRYSGSEAYLYSLGALYHLVGGPVRAAGALHWSEDVDGTKISVTVDCPLPPGAIPPLPAAIPSACTLLTRTIATQLLGHGVGAAQLLTYGLGPRAPHTTCIYQNKHGDNVSLDVDDAATIEGDSGWRTPAVSGLGVQAHIYEFGLLAVKGAIGIEVAAGLSGSQAENAAAEIRVARKVLAKLR